MAIIAVTDIETREAAEWAAKDCGATFPEVLLSIFYTLIVIIILMYVNVCTSRAGNEQLYKVCNNISFDFSNVNSGWMNVIYFKFNELWMKVFCFNLNEIT